MEPVEAFQRPIQLILCGEEGIRVAITVSQIYTKAPELSYDTILPPTTAGLSLDIELHKTLIINQS